MSGRGLKGSEGVMVETVELLRCSGHHARQRPETSPICKGCGGEAPAWESPFGGFFLPRLCDGCQEIADSEEMAAEEALRAKEALFSKLRGAGLTKGEILQTDELGPNALDPRLKGLDREPSNSWAFLHSPEPGCGKTTQLQLATRHYLSLGWSARYITQHSLTAGLRACEDDSVRLEMIKAYQGLDLLLIDEFGQVGNVWNQELLLAVLDGRYMARKVTIIASNWTLREIAAAPELGTRVSSRIEERCAYARRVLDFRYNHRSQRACD